MRSASLFSYCILFLFLSCQETGQFVYQEIRGETMGTTYSVKFRPGQIPLKKMEVDRELVELNAALSTYEKESIISRFNHSPSGISDAEISDKNISKYFFDNVEIAKEIHQNTEGFFEPTVMPLVNYWGFGYTERIKRGVVDTFVIDSILQQVGFDKLIFKKDNAYVLTKNRPEIQLDFSAIAKGYAIDHLADYLIEKKKIQHFLIDIGGENKASGSNADGGPWRVGISTPDEHAAPTSLDFIVELKDQSIATSGNYRNFYEVDGKYISHTINPKTGYFERNDLLSVSIIGKNCAVADAWATACMAMGMERARGLIDRTNGISGILIYQDTSGLPKYYYSSELDGVLHRTK